jgi:cytochrome c oxidase subunit 4
MAHVSTDIAEGSHPHSGGTIPAAQEEHQQHPLKVYFLIWGLLFVLSILSYLVDYIGLEGGLRWSLILIFMVAKAGLIMAIFMHLAWERLALTLVILLPPIALLVFVAIMASESNYTAWARETFFSATE